MSWLPAGNHFLSDLSVQKCPYKIKPFVCTLANRPLRKLIQTRNILKYFLRQTNYFLIIKCIQAQYVPSSFLGGKNIFKPFFKKKVPLPGFDIMVDSALDPHLLEVNTKPQLLPLPLDRSVISQSQFFLLFFCSFIKTTRIVKI